MFMVIELPGGRTPKAMGSPAKRKKEARGGEG